MRNRKSEDKVIDALVFAVLIAMLLVWTIVIPMGAGQ